jgi:hypothetical protein
MEARMSRKHYVALAVTLYNAREEFPDAREAIRSITLEIAQMAKIDNRNFNAGKFFEAAGFPELTGTRMGLN